MSEDLKEMREPGKGLGKEYSTSQGCGLGVLELDKARVVRGREGEG